jgi:hypothetical protein
MSQEEKEISCEAFQAQLPELIARGADVSGHPHLKNCELCSDLLAQLETIAEAARQLFPLEEPSDELWGKIEKKIKKN